MKITIYFSISTLITSMLLSCNTMTDADLTYRQVDPNLSGYEKHEFMHAIERNPVDVLYTFISAIYSNNHHVAWQYLSQDSKVYIEDKGGVAYFINHYPLPVLDLGKKWYEKISESHYLIAIQLLEDPASQAFHVIKENNKWKVDIQTKF